MKSLNLNRREKTVVFGAASFLAVMLLYQALISPLLERRIRCIRAISVKTAELEKIQSLQADYLALRNTADTARDALGKRATDFSLFSFLDGLNGKLQIRDNVSYMKPASSIQKETGLKISTVELKLLAITLEKLSQYLYEVEYSGNNLVIRRMTVSETETPAGYIDVQLQVETIEL